MPASFSNRPHGPGARSGAGPAGRLLPALAALPPSSFSMVMATGIVSAGLLQAGVPVASEILFWIALLALVALVAATIWRGAAHRGRFLADVTSPALTFGHFTFVAGLNVVGLHFDMTDRPRTGLVLAVVAGAAWLALTYLIPCVLLLREHQAAVLDEANGSWFLWVVATQSMSTACASAAGGGHGGEPFAFAAVALWGIGVMLYLMVGTLVTLRLLTRPNRPETLSPTYWIFMGATAISVLAGSGILALPEGFPVIATTHGFISGASFVLWSVGLWWVPLLVVFGIWRHVVHRYHLQYETPLWSIVFPLGMLATSSMVFGRVQSLPLVEAIGRTGVWVATAAWLVAILLMVLAGYRRLVAGRAAPAPRNA